MTHQLTFALPDYRNIVVIEDTQFSVDSVDNATSYDSICRVPSRIYGDYYAKHGVRLDAVDGSSISCLFLFHGGGRLRETNVAIHGDRLYLSGGVSLCSIELTQLRVLWTVDLLSGADNGLHFSHAHNCILAIGDYDVTCLDWDGGILWATIVKGLLTPDSTIEGNVVSVYDEDGLKHVLDINTGTKQTG